MKILDFLNKLSIKFYRLSIQSMYIHQMENELTLTRIGEVRKMITDQSYGKRREPRGPV